MGINKSLSVPALMFTLAVALLPGLNSRALGATHSFQGTAAAAMAQAVCHGRETMLKKLIAEGGDINALNKTGHMSLLYLAVRCGQVGAFRRLLAAGARPVARSDGEPIMSAVAKENDAGRFLAALFAAGVSPNEGVGAHKSPLDYAIGHDQLAGDHYAERMIRQGADLNHQDAVGRTPLFYAAIADDFAMIRTLIESGADPSIKDKRGETFQAYLTLFRPLPTYSKRFLKKYDDLRTFLRQHKIPANF